MRSAGSVLRSLVGAIVVAATTLIGIAVTERLDTQARWGMLAGRDW